MDSSYPLKSLGVLKSRQHHVPMTYRVANKSRQDQLSTVTKAPSIVLTMTPFPSLPQAGFATFHYTSKEKMSPSRDYSYPQACPTTPREPLPNTRDRFRTLPGFPTHRVKQNCGVAEDRASRIETVSQFSEPACRHRQGASLQRER